MKPIFRNKESRLCGYPINRPSWTGSVSFSLVSLVFVLFSFLGKVSAQSSTSPLSFNIIPYSDPDIIAPFRGAEQWHDDYQPNLIGNPTEGSMPPVTYDAYKRSGLSWWELETANGVYDWANFDDGIISAINKRRKFSFNIMSLFPGSGEGPMANGAHMSYPLYLHDLMQAEGANSADWITPITNHWVPNYNSPNFQARLKALLNALANHIATGSYNGVPFKNVIGYVDIGIFGSWGEWNHSMVINTPADYPAGRQPTAASMISIINAHIAAFPNYPLIIPHAAYDGNRLANTQVPPEVGYHALTATNNYGKIGWKRMNWGWIYDYINYSLELNPTVYNGMRFDTATANRWKYALICGEGPCGGTSVNGPCAFWDLPRQVRFYHASMIGNGNWCGEQNTSLRARDSVRMAFKNAGYRIVLEGGSLSSVISSGGAMSVTLNWKNVGIAPVYENWNVVYELQNQSTGAVVWTGNSSHQLKLWLPQSAATVVTDNFTLPASVPTGTYKLVLKIKDPLAYRDPMPLAIQGRQTDGGYLLKGNISVSPSGTPGNAAPTANAGSNVTITLPTSTTTLTGTGTDADGSISSYAWTQVSGPGTATIATPSAASTSISALVAGTYIFRLTVTDNGGATGTADVTVTVAAANKAPLVSAGNAISVTLPASTATLTGSATDADGTIASYAWTKVSGPAGGTIASPTAASTNISGLVAGTYTFKLTATDNQGATGSANVTVTVSATPNIAPTVTPGAGVSITLPTSTATISGTASDADGSIASYAWTQVSGPVTASFGTPATASTTVNGLTVAGSYVFKLTATDNSGAASSGNVTVTVISAANVAPTANAGSDITVTLPVNTATLTGSGTDSDGTISAYAWSKVSGPAGGTIASPKSAATNITGLLAGTYVFRLTVTDDRGATASDNVTVVVNAAPTPNVAPTANAGANITITLPTSSTTLNGSGTDSDGTIASYAWSQLSGPSASTISKPAAASTAISGLIAGTYTYRLTVTDNGGLTANSDVQVTVNLAPTNNGVNRLPVANAGQDQTLTLPANSASLSGSASSDPDGSISAYSWSQLSGPTTATIGSNASVTTTVSNLVKGTYQFQLTVWDDKNATSTAKVFIVVNDANQKAVIKFAADTIEVTLPVNNAELNASASYDPDGVISAYNWTFVNGPSTPGILSANAAKTTVNNLAAGTYEFNLAVTDNKGAVSNSKAVVVVSYSNTRIASQAFAIYPNPVQSSANISLNSDMEGKAVYQVTDMNGRAMISGEFTKVSGSQTLRIDMNNLRPGVYFLKLQVNDVRVGVKKLMKL